MIESLKSTLTFGKRLFVQERVLFGISAVGFILAAVCAVYVIWKGAIILPEGNVESAFSFNAALAVFILSISILIPVS